MGKCRTARVCGLVTALWEPWAPAPPLQPPCPLLALPRVPQHQHCPARSWCSEPCSSPKRRSPQQVPGAAARLNSPGVRSIPLLTRGRGSWCPGEPLLFVCNKPQLQGLEELVGRTSERKDRLLSAGRGQTQSLIQQVTPAEISVCSRHVCLQRGLFRPGSQTKEHRREHRT